MAQASALLLATTAWAEFDGGGSGGGGGPMGHYQLEDFGANGYDLVDDTPAFNTILSFFAPDTVNNTVFNGTIDIGEGTFYLDDSLKIDVDGVIIQGIGRSDIGAWTVGTILRIRESSPNQGRSGIMIGHKPDSSVTRGVQIRDLSIRDDITNMTGHCVWYKNVQQCSMDNVDVYKNRAYGGNGDRQYAAIYVQSETASSGGNAGTTGNTWTNCHIYCPGPGGGSGVGFGLLARTTGPAGFNNQNTMIACKFSNAESPGRSIFLTGHACDDPDDCSATGSVNAWDFVSCRVGGHAGIEFCSSSRNRFNGDIDVDPALGDTALFVQRESEDNLVIGRIDGYFFDEQASPNRKTQVWDPSWGEGLFSRGISFPGRTAGQKPAPLTGHPLNGYNLWYEETPTARLLLMRPNGSIDTLMIRGD